MKRMNLIDELRNGIEGTQVWNDLQLQDPQIQAAQDAFYAALEKHLPWEDAFEIEELANEFAVVYGEAAMWYGIQVAGALRDILYGRDGLEIN